MEHTASRSVFSARRLGLLLRRDVAYGYRGTLIAMVSIAGVIVLLSLLTMIGVRPSGGSFHTSFFSGLLFVGGFIYTSLVFREIHNGGAATLFLTLPSSGLEKFASKALVTSAGYAVATLVFSTVIAALSEGLNWLIFRTNNALFNPVAPDVLRMVAFYVVTQSVFLLGSVYYRKMAFLKTVGVVSLLSTVTFVLALLLAAALLGDHVTVVTVGAGRTVELDPEIARVVTGIANGSIPMPAGLHAFQRILEMLFWAALAPACWLIGYFKMREKEV